MIGGAIQSRHRSNRQIHSRLKTARLPCPRSGEYRTPLSRNKALGHIFCSTCTSDRSAAVSRVQTQDVSKWVPGPGRADAELLLQTVAVDLGVKRDSLPAGTGTGRPFPGPATVLIDDGCAER